MSSTQKPSGQSHPPVLNGGNADDRLVQLRGLLLGPEQEQLDDLRRRMDDPAGRSEDLSRHIAEAIAIRVKRDRKLQVTLQPVVEEALRISVARDPAMLATALFPIIGEAVRKAVAHALSGVVESLNQMLDRSFSTESWKWRLEAWRTGKSFGEVALVKSISYRVEQVFLIHRESGLLIEHVATADAAVQDTDLVSSMLTAIQDFVHDSFGGKKSDELEMMEVGDFKLWLQHGPVAILAAVVRGVPPPLLRQVFEREVEAIHKKYASELNEFQGDSAPLSGCRENLQHCLLGRGRADKKKKSYKTIAVFAAALLCVGAIVALRVRDNLRWEHYLQRLRGEPGIVVTGARRSWFSYAVTGLRDPYAVAPRELLGDFKIPERKVTEKWEPFLSLDPRFTEERKLELDKERLEKQVLRFDLNSTQLRADQFALLETTADDILSLEKAAALNGQRLPIEVSGHTDDTGHQELNAQLSEGRASTVVRALVKRGIAADVLVARGLGTRSAHSNLEDEYPKELDRRVTFKVLMPRADQPK